MALCGYFLVILGANSAPTATTTLSDPDAEGVYAGMVDVTDPDGDTPTFTLLDNPSKGSVVINADGSFTYTPTADARHNAASDNADDTDRLDGFTLTITDGHGGSVSVPVSLTVVPANVAPIVTTLVSEPGTAAGEVDGVVSATDADNDTLTYQVSAGPSYGTITLDPETGEFTYTPNPEARHDAAAADSGADSGTITITGAGSAIIDGLVAAGGVVYLADITTRNVTVINDSTGTISSVIPDVAASYFAALSPDGSRLYVPDLMNGGLKIVDTVTGSVTSVALPGPSNVGYGVAAMPNGLVYASNPSVSGGEVTVIDGNTGEIVDQIAGETPWRMASFSDFVYFTTFDSKVGVIDSTTNVMTIVASDIAGTPNAIAVSPDGTLLYITNQIEDGNSQVAVIDVSTGAITTVASDLQMAYDLAVSPDGALLYVADAASTTVSIIDTSTFQSTTIDGFTSPASLALSADGTRLYVANYTDGSVSVVGLSAPRATEDSFTVTVSDGHGGTEAVTISVPISPQNTPPSAEAAVEAPSGEIGSVTGTIAVTDDDNDVPAFSIATGPLKGTVVVNADGSFTYTPTADARHNAAADAASDTDRTDAFSVAVDDGHGGTTVVEITVAVDPTNATPTATATVGDPADDGAVAGLVDVLDADGDTPAFSIAEGPAKGTVVLSADGTFTYTPDPDARHQAAADTAGPETQTDTFTLTVTDGHGGTTTIEVQVRVDGANSVPVLMRGTRLVVQSLCDLGLVGRGPL